MIIGSPIGNNCSVPCIPCYGECKTSNGEIYYAKACSYKVNSFELDGSGIPRVVTFGPATNWFKLTFAQMQANGICTDYGYTSSNCNTQVCEASVSGGGLTNWRCETATFSMTDVYPYTTCLSERLIGSIRYGFWVQSAPLLRIQVRQDFETDDCGSKNVIQTYIRFKAIGMEILTVHCYFYGNFNYIPSGAPGCPVFTPGPGVDFPDDPFCDFLPQQYFAGTSPPKYFSDSSVPWSSWVPYPTCREMQEDGIEIGMLAPVFTLTTDTAAVKALYDDKKVGQSTGMVMGTSGYDIIANTSYEMRTVKLIWCNTSIPE